MQVDTDGSGQPTAWGDTLDVQSQDEYGFSPIMQGSL